MFVAALKSVEMLLLNMCNILELPRLFVCLGRLVKFSSSWARKQKKLLGYGLLGGLGPRLTLWVSNGNIGQNELSGLVWSHIPHTLFYWIVKFYFYQLIIYLRTWLKCKKLISLLHKGRFHKVYKNLNNQFANFKTF